MLHVTEYFAKSLTVIQNELDVFKSITAFDYNYVSIS